MQQPQVNDLFQPLTPDFFARDTVEVARALLGHRLIRKHPDSGLMEAFRIVETEAYTQEDPACHAFGRRTGRAAMLYEDPGLAYVYLIYGMYDCLNVVTQPRGRAGAVLFRALEPPEGTCYRTHGPGRLTKSLNITRDAHNGIDLTSPACPLYLAAGSAIPDDKVVTTTRIGITKAADLPWRFYEAGNPHVSVKAKSAPPG